MKGKELESAAIDAHRRGIGWGEFWRRHGADARAAEPHNARRYQKLVGRLLALVVSGNLNGDRAVGDDDQAPWETDDVGPEPKPSDTATAANIRTTFPPIAGPSGGPRLLRD